MRPNWAYYHRVSMQIHYYGLNHLLYLTKSTYRRARLYDSQRFRNQRIATLGELRRDLGFETVGYYMHNNPVKRGLVKEPGDWPWSSWRFYFLRDASLLAMDRVPREAGGSLSGAAGASLATITT
jgi:hypothetical protein